jgi:membrane dipeptidase
MAGDVDLAREAPCDRPLSRRQALGGLGAVAGLHALGVSTSWAATPTPSVDPPARLTDLGMELSPAQRAAGAAFVRNHPTVDVHCHPGRFFLAHLPYQTPTTKAFGAPFEERALADLHAGGVSAALFAGVADMRLLELTPTGIQSTRDFEPGEVGEDYRRQLDELKALVARHPGSAGRSPQDVRRALRRHTTAAVFAIEGGDFIEDRLERVHQAFKDGVRAITVVHYHVNQIGDIQTAPPVHGGLTALGKSIVLEMNVAGILVDLAHATFAVTRDAVAVSTKPMMISHTNLVRPGVEHPRLVSLEHAKLVTEAGGIVGSVPSGIGQSSFAEYVDSILRLVDALGVEHVAIGTDMDANYRPVFRSYRDWSLIPAALLARGLDEAAVAKVMGGNFLGVFTAVLGRAGGEA